MKQDKLIQELYHSIYFTESLPEQLNLKDLESIPKDIYQLYKYLRLQVGVERAVFNQYQADAYYQIAFICLTTFISQKNDFGISGVNYAINECYKHYINYCEENNISSRMIAFDEDGKALLKSMLKTKVVTTSEVIWLQYLCKIEQTYLDRLREKKLTQTEEEKLAAQLARAYHVLDVKEACKEYFKLSWELFGQRVNNEEFVLPKLNIAIAEQTNYLLVEAFLDQAGYEFNKSFGVKRVTFNSQSHRGVIVDTPSDGEIAAQIKKTKANLDRIFIEQNDKKNIFQQLGLNRKLKQFVAEDLFDLRFDMSAYLEQLKASIYPIINPSIYKMLFDWDDEMTGIDYPYQEAFGQSALILEKKLFTQMCCDIVNNDDIDNNKGMKVLIQNYIEKLNHHITKQKIINRLWTEIRLCYVPIAQQRADINDCINAFNLFFYVIETMLLYHCIKILQGSSILILANLLSTSNKNSLVELIGEQFQNFNENFRNMIPQEMWHIRFITINTAFVMYQDNYWYFMLKNKDYIKYSFNSNSNSSKDSALSLHKIEQNNQQDIIPELAQVTNYYGAYYFIHDDKVYETSMPKTSPELQAVYDDISSNAKMKIIGAATLNGSTYVFNNQNNCAIYQYVDEKTRKRLDTYSTNASKFICDAKNEPLDLDGLISVSAVENTLYCFFSDATYQRFNIAEKHASAKYSVLTYFLGYLKEFISRTDLNSKEIEQNLTLAIKDATNKEANQYISRIIKSTFEDIINLELEFRDSKKSQNNFVPPQFPSSSKSSHTQSAATQLLPSSEPRGEQTVSELTKQHKVTQSPQLFAVTDSSTVSSSLKRNPASSEQLKGNSAGSSSSFFKPEPALINPFVYDQSKATTKIKNAYPEINVLTDPTSNTQFVRHAVSADGNCGYTAFGITRNDAYQILRDNLNSVRALLQPVIKEVLLTEAFINYLMDNNYATAGLLTAFSNYQQAAQQNNDVDEATAQLYSYANDLAILNAYLDYDLRDKKIDAGWSHPVILQALAHIQGIKLYIWQLDTNQQVIPHGHYPHYSSGQVSNRIDLLYVNGNHFERLERLVPNSSQQTLSKDEGITEAVYRHHDLLL